MNIRRRQVLSLAGGSLLTTLTGAAQARGRRPGRLRRDVCVVGGGSAGTHAALRLQDQGSSVAVIERSGRLGGHAQTYVDPDSGVPINIGVIVFEDVELVRSYFARFGVVTAPFGMSGSAPHYVDFTTGTEVEGYVPPSQDETGAALFAYRQILATQFPYLDDGFELPDPVPEDLAMPLSAFVEKYSLQALVPTLFQFGQGLGDVLSNPALYVLKNFSAAVVDSILGVGFVTIPSGVATLYDAAAAELAEDVIYHSVVTCVQRKHRGRYPVEVHVYSPDGPMVVECKKLLVAFPPSPESFAPFDFDRQELALFRAFRANHYSTGVVRLSGLPAAASLQNVGTDTPYHLPPLPGVYGLNPTGAPDLWNVKYGSSVLLGEHQVQRAIRQDIRRIGRRGPFPVRFEGFATFKNHSPFELMASSAQVARGFHARINALQGYRNTFYTGATFQTHDSSLIWRFNERLVPTIFS